MPPQTPPHHDPLVVVAALILHKHKLLVCQRRSNDSFRLKWEFPGGKLHLGESLEVALARELREELGVESTIGAEVYRTRHRYAEHPGEIELVFFQAALRDAERIENLAFEKFEWASPEVLPSYDFLPADRELVERLAHGDLKLLEP
jgi:8-oxo-dGTP diphosphatase